MHPEYRTDATQWDYADGLRDVFIAMGFTLFAHLSMLICKREKLPELQAMFYLMIGIFSCDLIEKIQHYRNLKYPVDKITTEDLVIMGLTILITIYQYRKACSTSDLK